MIQQYCSSIFPYCLRNNLIHSFLISNCENDELSEDVDFNASKSVELRDFIILDEGMLVFDPEGIEREIGNLLSDERVSGRCHSY